MYAEERALEHTVMISITLAVAGAMITLLSGCTVQRQHPNQAITAKSQVAAGERPSSPRLAKALETAAPPAPVPPPAAAPVAAPAPEPVAGPTEATSWQPVYEPAAPSPPRPERVQRPIQLMGPGGKILTYEPGQKPVLSCAETGMLNIKFPAGETIVDFGVGASGEWTVTKKSMGVDLPIGVITIDRVPTAPVTELQVITDAEIYQFILVPALGGVSQKQATLFQVINPETEIRRAERQRQRAEVADAERRAREPQVPRLDPEQLRVYRVGGDRVPWAPLSVVGDNRSTIIQLPAGVATQPTLTAIEDGKEVRINTRTVLKSDGKGPRIVADQPFGEARLIGEGGSVSIVGGN